MMKRNRKANGIRSASAKLVVAALAIAMLAGCSGKPKSDDSSGKPFPKLQLLYNISESHKLIAETLQQMWKKELGIQVDLANVEWKTYLKSLQSLDYQIARAGWIGDYPDPNTFLDMFVTDGGNNQTGWSNAEYDRLIKTAAMEGDADERMKMFHDAEEILMKEMPIMPIYFYVNKNLVKDFVKGMHFNMRDLHILKYVYLEKNGKVLPPQEQVFHFNLSAEPETLDPGLMTGSVEFTISTQIFEGLVQYDPDTLEPIPGMAESWEVNDEHTEFVFHLRRNAKWTNGDPVTAGDFVYSWKRVLEPETTAEYAYQLFYIKNAKKYYDKEISDFSQVGLKAVDDFTLKVTLDSPTHFWLDLLAFHTLMPVNKKCVEKFNDKWTRPENIVTNGPFKLTEWKPKSKLVMTKNPGYYDAANVRLSKLVAYSVEDNITAVSMFEAGQSYWVNTIPLPYAEKYMNDPQAKKTDFLAVYYYRFNTTKEPLNDPRVRRALNLAINKDELVKFVTKSGEKTATTFVPHMHMKDYEPPQGEDYNPEEARRLLREAGYAVKTGK
ncbi:MAG: Periplasmic oligopeptide-binding protein precursor [bacterium ADurb.Bin236]|nr:MAG: Periplasmic oligopeptide-binding protein precursor [bacterium ADurb.Bin236]HOY61774.1 ABC transporter substrate-binding protein [bacterium]HPN93891.1 ABC transporter substrate-binding protein [bacterium]